MHFSYPSNTYVVLYLTLTVIFCWERSKQFRDDFGRILKERETKESQGDRIREMLEIQKAQLNQYLHELTTIQASLSSWKQMQTIK